MSGDVYPAVWRGIGVLQDMRMKWGKELDEAEEKTKLGVKFEKSWRVIVFERLREVDNTVSQLYNGEVTCV